MILTFFCYSQTNRVVGFEVAPESRATTDYEIKDGACSSKANLAKSNPSPLLVEAKGKLSISAS